MGLAAEIVKRREALGWSQNALARRADVQQPTLQRIEAGKTADPNVSIVVAIARALGASVEELVGEPVTLPMDDAGYRGPLQALRDELLGAVARQEAGLAAVRAELATQRTEIQALRGQRADQGGAK